MRLKLFWMIKAFDSMDLSWGIWERRGQPEHVALEPNFTTDSDTEKLFDLRTFYHLFPKWRKSELCLASANACTAPLQSVGSPTSWLGNIATAALWGVTQVWTLLQEQPAMGRAHSTSHCHHQPSSWTCPAGRTCHCRVTQLKTECDSH